MEGGGMPRPWRVTVPGDRVCAERHTAEDEDGNERPRTTTMDEDDWCKRDSSRLWGALAMPPL